MLSFVLALWVLINNNYYSVHKAFTEIGCARGIFSFFPLATIFGPLGSILGPSWGILGRSWGNLGAILALLGPLEIIMGPLESFLGSPGAILEPS